MSLWKYVELYRRLGFSIIPVKRGGKEPLVKWSEYQKRKPTEDELRKWFSRSDVNIGIVCGAVSGNLAVLDFDNPGIYEKFFDAADVEAKTLVVKTSRGLHVYLRSSKPVQSFKIPELKLDVKGEGSYVVAPPSLHPSGAAYEFLSNPWGLREIPTVEVEGLVWVRVEKFKHGKSEGGILSRLVEAGLEAVKEAAKIDDELRAEAERILSSPDPESGVNELLDDIIAGEHQNKNLVFKLLLSGKLADPRMKQIILLKGEPGGGKTHLMTLADAFKCKDVGRFTEHALDYSDLAGYEVLKIKEFGVMDVEKTGVSTVKFLSSDDRGYTVEYVVRDKDGRFRTEQRRIPPITVITSTTRIEVDPQFQRRAWIVNVDESPEQTRRVLDFKAELERERGLKVLGLIRLTSEERARGVLRNLVELLNPVDIIIPFPKTLSRILNEKILRVRGDYDKVITLVKLHHILIQRKLQVFEFNGRRVVFANIYETLRALMEALEVLRSMASGLESRSRKLIEALEQLGLTEEGDEIDIDIRGKISRMLGKSERTVRNLLNNWCNMGYMSKRSGKGTGSPHVYTLLYPLHEIQNRSLLIREIDAELIKEMKKEAKKFLEQLRRKGITGVEDVWSVITAEYKLTYPLPPASKFPKKSEEEAGLESEKKNSFLEIQKTSKIETSDFEKKLEKSSDVFGNLEVHGVRWEQIYDWLLAHGGCAGGLAVAVEHGLHMDELCELVHRSRGELVWGPTREMLYVKPEYERRWTR